MNRTLHALLVEDSEPDARLMLRELRLAGYDVEPRRVETADQLNEALATQTWDIVLCDYALPQFGGDEALRIVKDSGLDLPFIFVSGKIGEETAVKAMKAGAHDYVMKNNLARLAAAIERELGEAQIRKESRQAEEMMRASEHKYRRLFESMRDSVFLVAERSCLVIDVNPQAERLIQRSRAEIVGMDVRRIFPPGADPLAFLKPPGDAATAEDEQSQTDVLRTDGAIVPTDVRVSRMELQGHKLMLLLFRDMTRQRHAENELRHSHEQLRALAARLQAVREEERTRVAREIHDELGQMLTGLKMDLRWVESDLDHLDDSRLNPILEKVVSATALTDALAKSVQRIAAELRPGILDRLGLVMALKHEAGQFQQRSSIECKLTMPEEEPRLPAESATQIFRIFQEAMTNVARHSGARNVQVEFQSEPGAHILEIRDDGRGISAEELCGPHSLGVLGMKERAHQLGGELMFAAGANGGTILTLRIPDNTNSQTPC